MLEQLKRKCVECNKDFYSMRSEQMYCSVKCKRTHDNREYRSKNNAELLREELLGLQNIIDKQKHEIEELRSLVKQYGDPNNHVWAKQISPRILLVKIMNAPAYYSLSKDEKYKISLKHFGHAWATQRYVTTLKICINCNEFYWRKRTVQTDSRDEIQRSYWKDKHAYLENNK